MSEEFTTLEIEQADEIAELRERAERAEVEVIRLRGGSRVETGMIDYYDIKLKGWNCRSCKVFNSEEKEYQTECRCCSAKRPVACPVCRVELLLVDYEDGRGARPDFSLCDCVNVTD